MTQHTRIFYARALALATIAAFVLAAGAPARSQNNNPGPPARPLHSKVTPQEKQQSNNEISAGLTQLNGAASDLTANNPNQATAQLNTALADLSQALPIYHGWRGRAMNECRRALRQLSNPKRASLAPASIAQAISDANTALQNAADEVTE